MSENAQKVARQVVRLANWPWPLGLAHVAPHDTMMRLFQSIQARHEIAKLNLIVKFHFSNNFTQLEKCSAVIGSHMERHRSQSAIPVFRPLVDMRRPSPLRGLQCSVSNLWQDVPSVPFRCTSHDQ